MGHVFFLIFFIILVFIHFLPGCHSFAIQIRHYLLNKLRSNFVVAIELGLQVCVILHVWLYRVITGG